jgi:serine protease AprX
VTDSGVTYLLQYDAFTVGAGYLDLQAAVSSIDIPLAGLNARSPSATYDAACDCVYFVQSGSTLGGSNALWGSHALWEAVCS